RPVCRLAAAGRAIPTDPFTVPRASSLRGAVGCALARPRSVAHSDWRLSAPAACGDELRLVADEPGSRRALLPAPTSRRKREPDHLSTRRADRTAAGKPDVRNRPRLHSPPDVQGLRVTC